jgi:hypothetical protein
VGVVIKKQVYSGKLGFVSESSPLVKCHFTSQMLVCTFRCGKGHFLKESSPNARWVFRIRFQNPVVFTFSESGCFFRFSSFFVLRQGERERGREKTRSDLVVTGNRVS